jgi:hypothetical protein
MLPALLQDTRNFFLVSFLIRKFPDQRLLGTSPKHIAATPRPSSPITAKASTIRPYLFLSLVREKRKLENRNNLLFVFVFLPHFRILEKTHLITQSGCVVDFSFQSISHSPDFELKNPASRGVPSNFEVACYRRNFA